MAASLGLKRAKRMLHKRFSSADWYSGVGIVPADGGLGLRLTVSNEPNDKEVPKTYYGFPVEVVVMGRYSPRTN